MDKHGQIDMLHGPIWNKLPRFAFPIAATAILEQLFNASDVAVVGASHACRAAVLPSVAPVCGYGTPPDKALHST